MTTTFIAAGDEIYSRINDVWKAQTPAIFSYTPKLYWPGVVEPAKVDGSKSWARVTRRTVEETQSGFVACSFNSKVRYTNSGLIFIQLFGALSETGSDRKIQQIGELLKNAFKRKCTGSKIVFRNSRIEQLDTEDLFVRYNVVFEYEYDELI